MYVVECLLLLLCLTPRPTLRFCPGGSLAHSHRGDLGGVASWISPKACRGGHKELGNARHK